MRCECADAGCVCHGKCNAEGRVTLYRVDMEDATGTLFCEQCAADAMESGLFTDESEEESDDEPSEGDYVTEDHLRWYEHGTGKLLLTTAEDDDHCEAIKAHMAREGFFPNAWFLSDHSNFHRIEL
jgi:hypothetical protein